MGETGLVKKVAGLGLRLSLICAVAGLGLSITYSATREKIARQIWESQIRAAMAVLPEVQSNEDFKELVDIVPGIEKEIKELDKIFEGYRESNVVGYALQMRPRGYGGPMTVMVGVDPAGVVTDMRVVEHRETPGLGSAIEDLSWSRQFKGKTIADRLKVNKDIDSLSGATISSKAVTKGVKRALEVFAVFRKEGK